MTEIQRLQDEVGVWADEQFGPPSERTSWAGAGNGVVEHVR